MGVTSNFDSSLLDQLRSRDPALLTEIVRDNSVPLLRAARGMGFSGDEAEDLVQDVFATFLASIERFEGRSQLRTWLFGILHRKAWELRRKLGRESATETLDEAFDSRFDAKGNWTSPPRDFGKILESQELGLAIEGCLGHLSSGQRSAFVLREIEDLESEEICKILSVTATNMGVLLFRARTRLRECLEAKGWGTK